MSLRQEFVSLAQQDGANLQRLCERFGVSRTTGYKWLTRARAAGPEGLRDQSRRPHTSPAQTPAQLEARILTVRDAHPAWGGRKLHAWLRARGEPAPSPSTITAILRRHGRLTPPDRASHAYQRFEHPVPHALWQMDFKGHIPLSQGRCHPLTVLDDHSRFAVGLEACADERGTTVQARLTAIFRRYGLPAAMLMDNGAPWGNAATHPYTPVTVWLLRLGIGVHHGRPYHPQTQGKEERFHRTLKAEVLQGPPFADVGRAQQAFDAWRDVYNLERPHQAVGDRPPVSRYQPSGRAFPEILPPITYTPDDLVRRVQSNGEVSFQGRTLHISKAFRGYPVALRPTLEDGVWQVVFCAERVATLDLREVPRQG